MSFEYFEKIIGLLQEVEQEEAAAMEEAVTVLVKAIENKKAIFAFGASHAGMLTMELFFRAGGLMVVNPIFGRELMLDTEPVTFTSRMERLPGYGKALAEQTPFEEGDVVILHSVSGRNTAPIEVALEAKKKGVTVISITSMAYTQTVSSRHPSGKKLFEVSDIVLDNHGEPGDALCEIPGLDQKVGASSTITGAAILNAIVVETVKKLKENGMEHPPIFYSANLEDGEERNGKLFEQYQDVIHYRY